VRPYVILSAAVSLDGYLDDGSQRRLILSDAADLDRVDALRAGCDAILVGANTVRRDNPRLRVRSAARRAARAAAGKPSTPLKVTLTRTGDLDPTARFFEAPAPLVFCPATAHAAVAARLGSRATVVVAHDLPAVLADLAARGVARLLVEGGTTVHSAFLAQGQADELLLAVAPLLVGDPAGARFLAPGRYPAGRLPLTGVERVGDLAVLRYVLPRDE
jgi:5-amino-6-(5-phosphoribosylamino)uracil reductase